MRLSYIAAMPFLFMLVFVALFVQATMPTSEAWATDKKLKAIADFKLRDELGREHRLADYNDKQVIVVAFLGTSCPLAKLYGRRLSQLSDDFGQRDVQFFGVNSNQQDSQTELAAYARKHELTFPQLKDPGNKVADLFGAERTPEVFVLDRQRHVAYRGRIDDQYGIGYSRDEPREHYLKQAIEQLLAGEVVGRPETEAVGCQIGRVRKPDPGSQITWSNQIVRIFHKHCVECHREGEIAPFPLVEYEDVVGWGPTIAEVIREQRMPPWHASPAHGDFLNQRLMTEEEKKLVYQWVKAGSPEGDSVELPELPKFSVGWQLPREPDQVIEMRAKPFAVPADGTVEYQYFVIDPKFKEDKWIAAAEIVPGNRAVVHHAIAFVRPPDRADFRGIGWLAAYVPGQRVEQLGPGLARRVPAGSKIVFQMHYTPNGSEQEDLTRMGLIFTDPSKVREEVVTLLAVNQSFEIPPHAENFRVDAVLKRFPAGGRLLAMVPHMHLRGRAFRVDAEFADQPSKTLLDVPHYDFNWQTSYLLSQPLQFPPETKLRCIARFDNSAGNLNNPDPTIPVHWGDQTNEEMVLGYFAVALPVDADSSEELLTERELLPELQAKAEKKARRLFKQFDSDGDGQIRRAEVTDQFAVFAFNRYDTNDDRILTLDEITQAVKRSLRRKKRRRRN